MIKPNEGVKDRVIRVFLGAIAITGGFFLTGALAIVLWVIGGLLFVTGVTGYCLLYMPFGINTCEKK